MRFNKLEMCGVTVLAIGIILLVFTFINAYLFLQEPLSIVGSAGFTQVFGEALGPLIVACIRIMYMGIMGWIGSLLTMRGLALLNQTKIMLEPKSKIEQKRVETTHKVFKEAKKPPITSEQAQKPIQNAKAESQRKPETTEAEEEKKKQTEPQPQAPEIVVVPPPPQQVSNESPT